MRDLTVSEFGFVSGGNAPRPSPPPSGQSRGSQAGGFQVAYDIRQTCSFQQNGAGQCSVTNGGTTVVTTYRPGGDLGTITTCTATGNTNSSGGAGALGGRGLGGTISHGSGGGTTCTTTVVPRQ